MFAQQEAAAPDNFLKKRIIENQTMILEQLHQSTDPGMPTALLNAAIAYLGNEQYDKQTAPSISCIIGDDPHNPEFITTEFTIDYIPDESASDHNPGQVSVNLSHGEGGIRYYTFDSPEAGIDYAIYYIPQKVYREISGLEQSFFRTTIGTSKQEHHFRYVRARNPIDNRPSGFIGVYEHEDDSGEKLVLKKRLGSIVQPNEQRLIYSAVALDDTTRRNVLSDYLDFIPGQE